MNYAIRTGKLKSIDNINKEFGSKKKHSGSTRNKLRFQIGNKKDQTVTFTPKTFESKHPYPNSDKLFSDPYHFENQKDSVQFCLRLHPSSKMDFISTISVEALTEFVQNNFIRMVRRERKKLKEGNLGWCNLKRSVKNC